MLHLKELLSNSFKLLISVTYGEICIKLRKYTWVHCKDYLFSLARLDRFYSFKHQFNIFKSCQMNPVGFSDQSAVLCSVLVNYVKSSSAYWHFNTSLLDDKHFKDSFTLFWDVFKQQKYLYSSLQQWWDCGKVQIKIFCQQYTLNVTREITGSMTTLEAELVDLYSLSASTGKKEHTEALTSKKTLLANLLDIKAQGALVRSRFQNITQMDAPSKIFFSMEKKKNSQSRIIHSLVSDTGQELTKTSEIREVAAQFYKRNYIQLI